MSGGVRLIFPSLSPRKISEIFQVTRLLMILLCFVPALALAQSATRKKYYYYAVVGESGGWNFSNSSTKAEYNQFKNDWRPMRPLGNNGCPSLCNIALLL